ncbi:MAG: MDR/zinc-dependent alcohol dehydrogenase-like family protein [Phycisphaerae bacterium]
MLALVFDKQVRLRTDYPEPRPSRSEALVAVRLAGVCSTDLEVTRGYMGFSGVMGHEFVGTVVAGPQKWHNQRVVAEINCVCGKCDMCKAGLSNHCRDRTVLGIDGHDGVFAEYVTVPVRNLHAVPDSVADEQAVFVEPLAAAFQIVRQIDIGRSDKVVVLGDGRLGQLVARALKTVVNRPLLVGRHESKLEAAEKAGIQTELAGEFTPRADVDVVVDATGSPEGLETAMRAVRPRGVIVLKSTHAAGGELNLAPLVINEVTVIGSRCGPFPDAIAALSEGAVDVSALVTGRFGLREAPAALEAAARGEHIKVLIDVA